MNQRLLNKTLCALLFFGYAGLPLFGTTWYVRPIDGGTIQQCNGRYNAAYTRGTSVQWVPIHRYNLGDQVVDYNGKLEQVTTAGTSGTEYQPSWNGQLHGTAADAGTLVWTNEGTMLLHQNCAVNSIYWLATQNNSNLAAWAPIYTSGDTIIWSGSGIDYFGSTVGAGRPGQYWLNCLVNGSGCALPSVAGVTYRGSNAGSCTLDSAKARIRGVNGLYEIMRAGSNDTFSCLDFSDLSACGVYREPIACDSSQDFTVFGLTFANTETNITVTDVNAHGFASTGFYGPTGTGFVGNRIKLLGNASSGWNTDNGTAGTGMFLLQNFDISWNGCAEEYPIVDPLPYNGCTDVDSPVGGGYGDGFGTASTASSPGWQMTFANGIVAYNTQDGLDTLHVSGTGSTVTETQILAYGNQGQQLKAGNGAQATMRNNVIVGNCYAMSTQAIPGTPAGFGQYLHTPCRAGDVAVVIETIPGLPATFQNNTIYSDGDIGLQVEFGTEDRGPTNTLLYNNNIFRGFPNAHNFNGYPVPIYSVSDGTLTTLTNPGASWTNNATSGSHPGWHCPHAGESAAQCGDPQLVDETYHQYGYGNVAPTDSKSVVAGAGAALPGITVDYTGQPRPNPPSIGAYEPAGSHLKAESWHAYGFDDTSPAKPGGDSSSLSEPSRLRRHLNVSIAIESLGLAALVTGVWRGLRRLRDRAPKA